MKSSIVPRGRRLWSLTLGLALLGLAALALDVTATVIAVDGWSPWASLGDVVGEAAQTAGSAVGAMSDPRARGVGIVLRAGGGLAERSANQQARDNLDRPSTLGEDLARQGKTVDASFNWTRDWKETRWAVDRLKAHLLAHYVQAPDEPIDLVCHSWGGVICYAALAELEAKAPNFHARNLTVMGSPLGCFTEGGRLSEDSIFDAAARRVVCDKSHDTVRDTLGTLDVHKLRNVSAMRNCYLYADELSSAVAVDGVENTALDTPEDGRGSLMNIATNHNSYQTDRARLEQCWPDTPPSDAAEAEAPGGLKDPPVSLARWTETKFPAATGGRRGAATDTVVRSDVEPIRRLHRDLGYGR